MAGDHTPVLLPQVLAALNIRASGTYLDATFGRGGHAGAILEKLIANGRLLCLDRDPDGRRRGQSALRAPIRAWRYFSRRSRRSRRAPTQVEPGLKLDGILFDLGVSSPQLDDAARGFSFMQDGPSRHAHDAGRGHERRGRGQRRAARTS